MDEDITTVDIDEDKDNVLFKKLRKLINLVDQLRDCGVAGYIKLPRIASLGTQSSGKSSVLESIVGLDFLPRGDGVVTRRPLELRLCHMTHGEPHAFFAEKPGQKFTDFNLVRETIEQLTDDKCEGEKNIVDDPIILTVYSPTCPDLTLIDLPGITRVPVGKQPKNIEEITKNMAKRYCEDNLTVILCVIAANSDIATSDGLKMAKEIDTKGERTIGVLTKLDIMDRGTDARRALLGEEIELKLGYVGVKNRSKQDLIDRIPMKEAFKKEKEFFTTHPAYKTMAPGFYGTDVLIQKLTKILFTIIRKHLPRIIKSINENLKKAEDELATLGEPMPMDDVGKISLLWSLLNKYCDTYRNVLRGKYDRKSTFLKDEGGYKIKGLFMKLLDEFTGDYKCTKDIKDEDINNALLIHEGDSIPGFPSVDAFYYLLKPQLDKLRDPIINCFNNVYNYLEDLSNKILARSFMRFPAMIDDVNDFVNKYFLEEREKTLKLVEVIIEQETSYLFTNDKEYIDNYTAFIPKYQKYIPPPKPVVNPQGQQGANQQQQGGSNQQQGANQQQVNQQQQQQQYQPPQKLDSKNVFIKEMRKRVEAYFKLIVRNLRDSIPKAIGNSLVKSTQENMKVNLYNLINQHREVIDVLNEPESIMLKRQELNRQIKVLRNAQKIIRRDPDLMQAMNMKIEDLEPEKKEAPKEEHKPQPQHIAQQQQLRTQQQQQQQKPMMQQQRPQQQQKPMIQQQQQQNKTMFQTNAQQKTDVKSNQNFKTNLFGNPIQPKPQQQQQPTQQQQQQPAKPPEQQPKKRTFANLFGRK